MKRPTLITVLALVFLEWLDFTLYLYLAKPIFSQQFFPASQYSMMLSFLLFAGAYLARPLGGWLFGRAADKGGRRSPMVVSAALMGIATAGICLLPTYQDWGLWSTGCLLGLRIIQGLALGGEVNTSAMFLVEHYPHSRLSAGSLNAASGALGMFMGGLAAAIILYFDIPWLWRAIFAVVGLLSLLVCRARKKLIESPEFHPNNLAFNWGVIKKYWRGFLNIAVIGAYVSITVYLCNVFWVSFATDQHLWDRITCAWLGSFAQFGSAMLALPIAFLCRKQKPQSLLQISMLLIAIAGPALFYFTAYQIKMGVLIALFGYILTNAFLCSAVYYCLYLQLPAQYRCRGVSTIWGMAAILGAICLPLAEHAVSIEKLFWVPGFLVGATALISCMILQFNHSKSVAAPNWALQKT